MEKDSPPLTWRPTATWRALRLRAELLQRTRRFFDEHGFLEVETPLLSADTVVDRHLDPLAVVLPDDPRHPARGRRLWLQTSPEFAMKRLMAAGGESIYQITRAFRGGECGALHNPEFTMMECYWAYADYQDIMRLVENMIAFVAQEVLGTTQIVFNGQEVDLKPPWPRLNLAESIKERTGIDIFDTYADVKALWDECQSRGLEVSPQPTWGKLVEELLGEYVEPSIVHPAFIHTYPFDISPLAKQNPDDPRVVERFEAFVAGLEIGNAYSELNDPLTQRQRFLEQQKGSVAGDEEALDLGDAGTNVDRLRCPPVSQLARCCRSCGSWHPMRTCC